MKLKERFALSRFFSGEREFSDSVELNHRRIFILPTWRGLAFVLLLAVLLLIAFVYSNNLIYGLTFLLASLFFITILHTYRSLAGLVVRKGKSQPVFAGSAAGFEIHLHNPSDIERCLQIRLEDSISLVVSGRSVIYKTLYALTQRRGWFSAGTITLSSRFPLGLFRAWSPIRFELKTLVYPKPSVIELPFPQLQTDDARPGFSFRKGDEFYGIREYQWGDPIKRIHWQAYAKGSGLFTKEYAGACSDEIQLNYQLTPGEDVESRLSQLCRWVIDAERLGMRYGLVLPGLVLTADNGSVHYENCLRALALFH